MLEYCAYCGKAFQVFGGVWGYAYGGLYTCSYKCMRAMKEEDSVTEEQKRIVDELEGDPSSAQPPAVRPLLPPQDDRKKSEERAKEETPEAKAMRETMADRYKYGWMCPMCRMVWSPWISACNCQRKEKEGEN